MRGGHAADNDRSCPTQLVHICALRRTHFGCGCRFVSFLANCAENSLSPQMGISTLTRYIGRLGVEIPPITWRISEGPMALVKYDDQAEGRGTSDATEAGGN